MRRFLTVAAIVLAVLLTTVPGTLQVMAEGWPSPWGEVSPPGGPPPLPEPQISPEMAARREELSTHVVIGKVIQVTPFRYQDDGSNLPYTETLVSVQEILRGTLNSPEIVIIELLGVHVDSIWGGWHNAEFSEGEVVKLYLNSVTEPAANRFLVRPLTEQRRGAFFEVVFGHWGKELIPDDGATMPV